MSFSACVVGPDEEAAAADGGVYPTPALGGRLAARERSESSSVLGRSRAGVVLGALVGVGVEVEDLVVVVVVREENPPPPATVVVVDDGEGEVVDEVGGRCLARVEKMRWCLDRPRAMRLKIWLTSAAEGGRGLGLSSWSVMLMLACELSQVRKSLGELVVVGLVVVSGRVSERDTEMVENWDSEFARFFVYICSRGGSSVLTSGQETLD